MKPTRIPPMTGMGMTQRPRCGTALAGVAVETLAEISPKKARWVTKAMRWMRSRAMNAAAIARRMERVEMRRMRESTREDWVGMSALASAGPREGEMGRPG